MSSTKQSSLVNSSTLQYEDSLDFAIAMDAEDPLRQYRNQFLIPAAGERKECIYLAGNSLGLQPRKARTYIEQELDDWANLGVEGHFEAKHPWLPYHENLTEMSARLVGALPSEVVVMNTLTVNLHLMMVSFYRPTKERYKIVTESGAFPSDQYAVASQAKFHGYKPEDAVVELTPRDGESTLRTEDILSLIDRDGDKIALIVLGNVNYLTGQAFEVDKIARAARLKGCNIGLNLAHGAGNLVLKLHDWDVDFAVWCTYKYLNAGPGGLAGCFVHERHATNFDLPRFAGWWGHNKKDRFKMGPDFDPIAGAEGWQLSNPPIFQLAALRASLEIFDAATMPAIRQKSERITGYLEYLLNQLPPGFCSIITPHDPEQRGSQLSIRLAKDPHDMLAALKKEGAICDFRNPDIIRATPIPLYVKYQDVFDFAKILARFAC
jgi:kynureninase